MEQRETTRIEERTPEEQQHRAAVAAILAANDDGNAGFNYEHCREPGRGWIGTCNDCKHEVYHPHSCDLRICNECASRRIATLTARLTPPITKLIQCGPKLYTLKHIILSTNVCLLDYIEYDPDTQLLNMDRLGELREIVRKLRVSIRHMFQERFNDPHMGAGVGMEFGPGGLMLHFHVLAYCGWYPRSLIQADWATASEGHGHWAYVRQARREFNTKTGPWTAAVGYVVKEVVAGIGTKYSKRDTTAQVHRVVDTISEMGEAPITAAIHFLLKGIRRFQTFGSFYKLSNKDEDRCGCPLCGGKLTWQSEIEWMRNQESTTEGLSLLRANNFSTHQAEESKYRQCLLLNDPIPI